MWIEKSENKGGGGGDKEERTQMGGKLPQAHKNVERIMGFDIVLVNGIVSQCHTPLPFFPCSPSPLTSLRSFPDLPPILI